MYQCPLNESHSYTTTTTPTLYFSRELHVHSLLVHRLALRDLLVEIARRLLERLLRR